MDVVTLTIGIPALLFLWWLKRTYTKAEEPLEVYYCSKDLRVLRRLIEHPHYRKSAYLYYCTKCLSLLSFEPIYLYPPQCICTNCNTKYGSVPISFLHFYGSMALKEVDHIITEDDVVYWIGEELLFEIRLSQIDSY